MQNNITLFSWLSQVLITRQKRIFAFKTACIVYNVLSDSFLFAVLSVGIWYSAVLVA